MKKIIALAIAVLMLAALAVPAFATNQGDQANGQAQTTVRYEVTETFTYTISAEVVMNEAGGEVDVAVSALNIRDGRQLTIGGKKTDGNRDVVTLTTTEAQDASDATVIVGADVVFTDNVYTGDAALTDTIALTWDDIPTVAANYSGVATFVAEIGNEAT